MCLKVQEERRSGTRFNEKRNITNSSFERNMKSAADSIQSPNRFELLNCETTENDGDDHPYHKDNFIVGINTINYHSRYKPSKRPEIVTNRFPENQRIFQKKCTVSGEKTYKETVTKKTNTAFTNNVAILADSIISFNRGIKPEFNKTLRTGRARFKHFPVASSKDLLHYVQPTLEEQNFKAAIIQIGIIDVLYESSSRRINLLLQNIREIRKMRMSYKVKYVFISSLTISNRISHQLLSDDLFRDGLHLQNSVVKRFCLKISL